VPSQHPLAIVHVVPTGQVDTPPAEQAWMQVCPRDVCVHACAEEQLGCWVPPLLDDPHAASTSTKAATGAPAFIQSRSIAR